MTSSAPQYSIISTPDGPYVTVFGADDRPLVAGPDHPNSDAILAAVIGETASATELRDLFDVGAAVQARFDRLSDRVSVRNGRVYLDGDEARGSITDHIVRFLDAGVPDWEPLVKFYENIQSNPNEHSREQLYDWLDAHDFTITPEGAIVGYKGVEADFRSVHAGTAIVDGEQVEGKIPNAPGTTVEMPRSSVHHDPSSACSTGLHVGTYAYAESWARGAMLEVHVNPRDVVSVPTDASGGKVRVCRYEVIRTLDAPYSAPLTAWESQDEEPLDEEDCGDPDCWVCN